MSQLLAFNLSSTVDDVLSTIAQALRVPVEIVALLLLVLLVFELGRALIEWWLRIRPGRRDLVNVTRQALTDPQRANEYSRQAPSTLAAETVRRLAAAKVGGHPDGSEHALADFELGVQRSLDRTRMLVRFGPAVGLMGTLIPLAPGLTALGDGNFKQLAGDLNTAFGATVIGLLVGTAAFGLTLIRTRMYTEDLASLERGVALSTLPISQMQTPQSQPGAGSANARAAQASQPQAARQAAQAATQAQASTGSVIQQPKLATSVEESASNQRLPPIPGSGTQQ